MRFLFLTIQLFESDFYGEVGAHLRAAGHDVVHVTVSRRSARRLRERGFEAISLLDRLGEDDELDVAAEVSRIEAAYAVNVADVYRTDAPSAGMPAAAATERTVRYFRALERVFEEVCPDILVPEVGSETPRTAAHSIALSRGVRTLFLFYTIFPQPLRLYVDTMHAPIVPPGEVRPLGSDERREVDAFISEFTARAESIRAPRRAGVTTGRLVGAATSFAARVGADRDNDYLRPERWVVDHAQEARRRRVARKLYRPLDGVGPFVYFPLHVVDDYKIERVIPHLADQAAIVERLAASLPEGYELILKEHPLSIGRNDVGLLRKLASVPRARLVDPTTSTHDLIERSDAVAVISSTVGLEALLYRRAVLTLGRPFYAGYGLTVDVDSIDELAGAIPGLLAFQPDATEIAEFLHAAMGRCYPGRPVLVDRSPENAARLAESLSAVAGSEQAGPWIDAGSRVAEGGRR